MTTKPRLKIQNMRENGLIVRVSHRRIGVLGDDTVVVDTVSKLKKAGEPVNLQPRGGVTVVVIQDEDGNTLAKGEARCSERDNFSRRLGTAIALGRAMHQLQ